MIVRNSDSQYICLPEYIHFHSLLARVSGRLYMTSPGYRNPAWKGPAEELTLNEYIGALERGIPIYGNTTYCIAGNRTWDGSYSRGWFFVEAWRCGNPQIVRSPIGVEHACVSVNKILQATAAEEVCNPWPTVAVDLTVIRLVEHGSKRVSKAAQHTRPPQKGRTDGNGPVPCDGEAGL